MGSHAFFLERNQAGEKRHTHHDCYDGFCAVMVRETADLIVLSDNHPDLSMSVVIRVLFVLFCLILPVGSMMIQLSHRVKALSTLTTNKQQKKEAILRTTTLLKGSTSSFSSSSSDSSQQQQQQQYVYTSRSITPRYTGPTDLTEQQKSIRDSILQSRPRTGLSGPFGPWLAVPDIAEPAQQLGRACRYGTSLSFRESELVILLTGAKMKSHAEFDIHVGEALKAGLSMAIIQSIPRDEQFSKQAVETELIPKLIDDENQPIAREVALARFTAELLDDCTVSDQTYADTKAALGNDDAKLVEVTSIVGYYTYVAFTLNVFRIPTKSE